MSLEGTLRHSSVAQFAPTTALETGLQQILKQHEMALRQLMSEICSNDLEDTGLDQDNSWSHGVQCARELRKPALPSSKAIVQKQAECPNVQFRDLQEQPVETMDKDALMHNSEDQVDLVMHHSEVQADPVTGVHSRMEKQMTFDIQGSRIEDVEDQRFSYIRQHERSRIINIILNRFQLNNIFDKAASSEPRRVGRLADFVQSHIFHTAVIVVVILNCIHTILDTNWELSHIGEPRPVSTHIVEISLACFYVLEVTLRLIVHRWYFFCNGDMTWNILDLSLVSINVVELILQRTGLKGTNLIVARTVRIFRVAKVLRAVRLMYFLTELKLMVTCLLNSGCSLFWAFIVLGIVKALFAVLLVQQIGGFLAKNGSMIPNGQKKELFAAFGSVEQGLLTLFQDISGGQDWGDSYKIISPAGSMAKFLYIAYIVIMWLSVTNIISSMFIEKALKIARPDMEEKMLEACEDDLEAIKELKGIFQMIDTDKSGKLSFKEFQTSLTDVRIQSYFELREISLSQASMLFEMLSLTSATDEIDVDTFVTGCMRMRGYATNIDMVALSHQMQLLSNTLSMHIQEHRQGMKELDANICQALGRDWSQ